MSDRFSQGTIAKKLQCCVAFNGRVSELLKLFNRKCIPTRKTDFWTKKTKNNWPLPSCRFSCPVNMGAQSLCKMQKIGLLQPIPWSIDTKKEPALALAQTYSISPSSSWPEAPSTKSPAGGICNWFPSLTHERHPRQLTLLGVPFSYSFMLCCRKPFISLVYKSIIFHFVFQTWNQNFEIIIMGDLIPIIEGPVKFREGKKV